MLSMERDNDIMYWLLDSALIYCEWPLRDDDVITCDCLLKCLSRDSCNHLERKRGNKGSHLSLSLNHV